MSDLIQQYDRLCRSIAELGTVAVAFSGGVDSTLLLRAAVDAVGTDRVIAMTVQSEAVQRQEAEAAAEYCKALGVRHYIAEFTMLDVPGIRDNPPDRCYLCKRALFSRMMQIAGEQGFSNIVEGSNLDDDSDYRPGRKALTELGIRSPLREAGLTKEQIRALSKHLDLPVWDKPALACLATRIAYGERLTEEKLRAVEHAESFLTELGFRQVRVRVHGKIARIEVEPESLERLLKLRKETAARFRALGFVHVCLDLDGYRTGSMNDLLPSQIRDAK